ncbi:MAG: STAS domain-containing protein [Verrucomicrobiota bacterium]
MELTVENLEGGFQCIALAGRLDLKGTQEVDLKFSAFAGGGKKSVVVDMSKVEFVASIGIRMLLSNIKTLTASGAKMVILSPQKMVEDILKLSGLDTVAEIVHDRAAAIEALKQ